MRDSIVWLSLSLALVACGPSNRGDDGGDDDNPDGGNNSNTDNCSEEAKLIYTVDGNTNQLSRFDAVSKQFMDLGPLNCPASLAATPFSMGIDRNAGAWVLYSSGELFNVDTETLACTETAWSSPNGLLVFGMGFSTDTAGGTTDTLFIAGGEGPTDPFTGLPNPTSSLNTLNVASLQPTPVGTVNDWPELTGTGNAELWGFFPSETQPRIAQIDKTDGSAIKTFPLGTLAGMPQAWAFAFFGGDFFVFLQRTGEAATTVHQVNGMTGAIVGSTPTTNRRIVGAGVSTCAPTVIF
jgi:hypothetical protein